MGTPCCSPRAFELTYGNECKAKAAGAAVDFAGECAPEPAFCGGIAGIQCPAGEHCLLDGEYPDAGGHCVSEDSCEGSCGGQAPGACWCDELCVNYGDCCADAAQVCG